MEFLKILAVTFLIVLIGFCEVVISVIVGIIFDSIVVMGVVILLWIWINRIIMDKFVKRVDKSMA